MRKWSCDLQPHVTMQASPPTQPHPPRHPKLPRTSSTLNALGGAAAVRVARPRRQGAHAAPNPLLRVALDERAMPGREAVESMALAGVATVAG